MINGEGLHKRFSVVKYLLSLFFCVRLAYVSRTIAPGIFDIHEVSRSL